jgi:tetratricopeptide (TPR) repeat protein
MGVSGRIGRAVFGLVAAAVCLLGAVAESAGFLARRDARLALALAEAGRGADAIQVCEWSLRFNPYDTQALHLRAVQLKEAGRTVELWEALPRLLAVHPNQANALRLAGEQAFNRGDFARAADWLWEATWINPTPPISPSGYWRMTMLASARADRPAEARTAAIRALTLMPLDNYLRPADRRALLLDVADLFDAQSLPLTAAHLRDVAGRIAPD